MPYKFVKHTADAAFEATASTLEQLFVDCALATMEIGVDLKTVEPHDAREFAVEGKNAEDLLFNFIEEIIFLKDAEYMLFSKFEVKIEGDDKKGMRAAATAWGERIDPEKHVLGRDVKAITYHMYEVKKTKDGWKAFMIIDI